MKNFIMLGLLTMLVACDKAPTPFEVWHSNVLNRCYAQSGKGHYDENTKIFECFRAPFGRRSYKVFEEIYTGS